MARFRQLDAEQPNFRIARDTDAEHSDRHRSADGEYTLISNGSGLQPGPEWRVMRQIDLKPTSVLSNPI